MSAGGGNLRCWVLLVNTLGGFSHLLSGWMIEFIIGKGGKHNEA